MALEIGQKMMRVYFKQMGSHTHIRIFTGKTDQTLGKAGDICMTNEEFKEWREGRIMMDWKDDG